MRRWIRPLLLLCLAASLAGQPPDWQKYKNDDGNFSVLMPAQPKEGTSGQGDNLSYTIQALVDGTGYTVVYTKMADPQEVSEANYTLFKDAFMRGLPQCSTLTEKPATPALDGHIGRWYRMNCDVSGTKMTFVGNLYWGKHIAYAVLVMFPTGPNDPPGAKKFLDSFAVNK